MPVVGSLIVGFMARYGSEQIRGHGIPEAIESILMNGSRVRPRLAILKPLSAAISIGSGGPFGAEGPIIMTGGAFGSMIAQFFHLTSVERSTLLVAGAAAGMSATFAAPLAAVLLGCRTAAVRMEASQRYSRGARQRDGGRGAAIHSRDWDRFSPFLRIRISSVRGLGGCIVAGLARRCPLCTSYARGLCGGGLFSERLPIHWMWWPAIGGLFVGLGGLIFPQALGVGYDTIGMLLQGMFR